MMQDVCLNIMFAGYDTSASALMLLIQLVKKHPKVEKQLREEQTQDKNSAARTFRSAQIHNLGDFARDSKLTIA